MKPLLAQKVVRKDAGPELNEWEPAEHHLTHDGQNSFAARQKARIAAAQANATEARSKVRTIKLKAEKS